MERWSRLAIALALLVYGRGAQATAHGAGEPGTASAGARGVTLILYDDDGALGEPSAISAANLASHFGAWRAIPVRDYRPGDLAGARAAIYVGSAAGAPLPPPFLDEVSSGEIPVLWMAENLGQLAGRGVHLRDRYGFEPGAHEERAVDRVRYKNVELTREPDGNGPLTALSVPGGGSARVIATAVTVDGDELPWAVRSGNLTYVAENPFTATSETDRYLVLCDLLFDLLAPGTPERHRALVRIEDVLPTDDPSRLRAVADTLAAAGVPFAISIVPLYVDPRGADRPLERRPADAGRAPLHDRARRRARDARHHAPAWAGAVAVRRHLRRRLRVLVGPRGRDGHRAAR